MNMTPDSRATLTTAQQTVQTVVLIIISFVSAWMLYIARWQVSRDPCFHAAVATVVVRIRYADNEMNYCARCQTGGTVLADRSLSRLHKGDWPGTLH